VHQSFVVLYPAGPLIDWRSVDLAAGNRCDKEKQKILSSLRVNLENLGIFLQLPSKLPSLQYTWNLADDFMFQSFLNTTRLPGEN